MMPAFWPPLLGDGFGTQVLVCIGLIGVAVGVISIGIAIIRAIRGGPGSD